MDTDCTSIGTCFLDESGKYFKQRTNLAIALTYCISLKQPIVLQPSGTNVRPSLLLPLALNVLLTIGRKSGQAIVAECVHMEDLPMPRPDIRRLYEIGRSSWAT